MLLSGSLARIWTEVFDGTNMQSLGPYCTSAACGEVGQRWSPGGAIEAKRCAARPTCTLPTLITFHYTIILMLLGVYDILQTNDLTEEVFDEVPFFSPLLTTLNLIAR